MKWLSLVLVFAGLMVMYIGRPITPDPDKPPKDVFENNLFVFIIGCEIAGLSLLSFLVQL